MYKDDSDLGPSSRRSSGRLADITPWRGSNVRLQTKIKKKKRKNDSLRQESSARAIVGFLSSVKRRRKGFSSGWWWERDFSPCGVGDGSEKREAVIPSRVCPGEGVVILLLCMYFPAPRRLLLCLCCNVLLLCVLLAGRACCWLANCAGRVLHGSHCNALLSHYPLQERSPRAPRPSTLHHLSTLPFALPFFLPSPPPTPTHMQNWVNRAPPALRTDGCRKRQEPCFLLVFTPRSLSLIHLLKPQFFPSWLFVLAAQLFSNFIFSVWRVAFLRMQWMSPALFFKMQNGCAKA